MRGKAAFPPPLFSFSECGCVPTNANGKMARSQHNQAWLAAINANVEISRTHAWTKHAEYYSQTRTEEQPEVGTLPTQQNVAGTYYTRPEQTLRTDCDDEDRGTTKSEFQRTWWTPRPANVEIGGTHAWTKHFERTTRNAYSENITERSRDGSMEGVAFDHRALFRRQFGSS